MEFKKGDKVICVGFDKLPQKDGKNAIDYLGLNRNSIFTVIKYYNANMEELLLEIPHNENDSECEGLCSAAIYWRKISDVRNEKIDTILV